MNTPPNTFDNDTADTDILRAQIRDLQERNDNLSQIATEKATTIAHQSINIQRLVGLVEYIAEGRVDEVREWVDGDTERRDLVHSLTSINLKTDWLVTVTLPITITVEIEADDEDDARDNIDDYLCDNVTIDCSGADEFDYDFYACDIDNVQRN